MFPCHSAHERVIERTMHKRNLRLKTETIRRLQFIDAEQLAHGSHTTLEECSKECALRAVHGGMGQPMLDWLNLFSR